MILGARRALILLVALTASVIPPLTARASSPPATTNDPAQNTTPSTAFVSACSTMDISTPAAARTANDACDAAAAVDFAAVWKAESVSATFALPGDFDTLSVPLQLLAISDVERVGRGEAPMAGLSSTLDDLTLTAADNDTDPAFPDPFDGNWGGGNWAAAGDSALLDDFYWMYDDGLGSFNGDCTPADQSGCWGHRHDILDASSTPLVMGASVAYSTVADPLPWGTSMATEYISGDTTDQVDVTPTWATIALTLPAPGGNLTPPGGSTPPGTTPPSRHSGPAAVVVRVEASRHHVRRRHRVELTGAIRLRTTHAALAGSPVRLWWRHGSGRWHVLRVGTTNRDGLVHFVLHPRVTRRYRVQSVATGTTRAALSAPIRVRVG